jgi:hypothetical protein
MPLPSAEKRGLALEARANLASDRFRLVGFDAIHPIDMGMQSPDCYKRRERNKNRISGFQVFF